MGIGIIFEWDERKRSANLRKHGIDFADCAEVFSGPTHTVIDNRYEYGETRFLTQGLLCGRLISVVHTEEDGVVRVISMRKVSAREKESFFKNAFQD